MLLRAPLLALILLLCVSGSMAAAHDIQVERPGPVKIDLGSGERELLLHGTLVAAGDELVVTFDVPEQGEWRVELLVPDRQPERSGDDLPDLQVAGRTMLVVDGIAGERVKDPGTGVDYVSITDSIDVPLAAGELATITVRRGAQPTRVAARVHRTDSDVGFETLDPERTPRTLARLVAWDNTPAPGAKVPGPKDEVVMQSITSPEVWLPAGIGLGMLAVAVWWVRTGRGRARRPRADDEARP